MHWDGLPMAVHKFQILGQGKEAKLKPHLRNGINGSPYGPRKKEVGILVLIILLTSQFMILFAALDSSYMNFEQYFKL